MIGLAPTIADCARSFADAAYPALRQGLKLAIVPAVTQNVTRFPDLSGNGLDFISASTGPVWTRGVYGTMFGRTDSGTNGPKNTGRAAWIGPSSGASFFAAVRTGTLTGDNDTYLIDIANNYRFFRPRQLSAIFHGSFSGLYSPTTLAANTSYMIGCTFGPSNGAATAITTYLNGPPFESGTGTPWLQSPGNDPILLGRDIGNPNDTQFAALYVWYGNVLPASAFAMLANDPFAPLRRRHALHRRSSGGRTSVPYALLTRRAA